MTDEQKREIHRLADEGLSNRAIARLVDSTHVTVAKVLAGGAPPLEALPAHMSAAHLPAPLEDAPADDAPALEQARYLMREARHALRTAQACGDGQLAQRQTRNAAALMTVLARLESTEAASRGGFYITPEEIERAEQVVDQRMASLAERGPIRCHDCGRELSISLAHGSEHAGT